MGSKPTALRGRGKGRIAPAPSGRPNHAHDVEEGPANDSARGPRTAWHLSPARQQSSAGKVREGPAYVSPGRSKAVPRSPLPQQTPDPLEMAQDDESNSDASSVGSNPTGSAVMSELVNEDPLIIACNNRQSPNNSRNSLYRNAPSEDNGDSLKVESDQASSSNELTGRTISHTLTIDCQSLPAKAQGCDQRGMQALLNCGQQPQSRPPPFGICGLPFEIMVYMMKFSHQKDLMSLECASRSIAFCIHRDKFLHNYLRGRPESVRIRPRCQYPSLHLLCIFADRVWCTYGKADLLGMTPQGDTFTVFRGHEAPITSLVALGDNYLCSGSEDGSIKVWHRDILLEDPFSPAVERNRIDTKLCSTTQNSELENPFASIECMTVMGDMLVTAASDGVIRRFKVISRNLPLEKVSETPRGDPAIGVLGHAGAVICMASTADDLFTASLDRTAIRWKKDGSALVLGFPPEVTAYITTMFLSTNPDTVYTGDSEGGIVQYSFDWVPLRSVNVSGQVKCMALQRGLFFVGVEDFQGFRQLDMYLDCVAVFQCHDDVDSMAFYGDVLFTGKHLGPLTKWIVLPPSTWPSRIPEKRGLNRSVSVNFLVRL